MSVLHHMNVSRFVLITIAQEDKYSNIFGIATSLF